MRYTDASILLRFVIDLLDRVEQDDIIAEYFERLYSERKRSKFIDIAQRLRECGRSWFFDVYKHQRVKDLQNINFCKNRFCINCQKMRVLSRLFRFGPVLDKSAEEYDMYHLTLTVPNCRDSELENVVSVMFKSFSKFVRYFNGNAKVKRIDFSRYGYSGCLRSLEITYSLKNREAGKEYHPHLHCIFALKKGLGLVKEKTNEFSLSYGVLSRRFSDLEILIQKIWYLLNNEKKVTLRNIDGMSVSGYSCNIDKIDENSYYEVFKYSMKVYDEDSNLMSYEQFKVLYDTLYIRRTIQGYGEFYGIQSDEIDESFSVIFDTLIEELRKAETPEKTSNFIGDIFEDMCSANAWTYISRKSIHNIPGEEITAFLNEPSSKERLDTALERLSLKKEKNRQEKQARIAEYIRHRFGGQIYINKRNEHCFKASGPKQLTIERILSERDLEEKITGLRTEYTLRSKKSWRGSLYHKNKIHEEQLS